MQTSLTGSVSNDHAEKLLKADEATRGIDKDLDAILSKANSRAA